MENQTEFDSTPLSKLHSWIFFKPRTITLLIVIIFLAIGIKFRWEALDCIRLVDWITRDYDRAFHLVDGNYFPLAGPETTGGGRLPGPFLYFLLSIPILFNYSYESIFFFNFILSCSSLISFFFIVKRFFGFYLASITTILFSINLLQIESIAYPINPSFIHIFAVAFFWLLMEFAVNKNYKVIPWIFLTITLAIQIHFSIASYYLVIILAAIILKIKIPLKQYLISLAIIFICLTPYFIYKKEFYQGVSEPSSRFFLDTQFSVLGVLKVITNYDTLNRIALNSFGDKLPFFYSPIIYNKINFWFLSIGFYGLLIFVFFKISNKKTKKIHREIALLLLFYIPGLIFGILSPTLKHYWYNYIFIPSATVLTAIVFETLFKVGKNYLQRSLVIIIFSIFIGYYIYFLKINFTSLQFASKQLRIGAFLNYYS